MKSIITLIPVLFFVSVITFSIVHLTPGDPASFILGDEATEQEILQLQESMGLNLPIHEQYLNWIGGAFKGDLGYSYFMGVSVSAAIIERLGPTISLSILAQILAIVIGIPLGIIAANRKGSNADLAIMGFSLAGVSIPSFLLGLFLMLFFSVKLGWFPVGGYSPLSNGLWNHLKFLVLPAVALGVMQAALIARMTRSSMLEVLNANFIKTARSKGLNEYVVIYKHALKNAFLPILTVIGQSLGVLITGAVVVEVIFNIPGIGQLTINSITRRDYAIIQGTILFVTLLIVFVNLITDLLYAIIDPRVNLNKK